MTRCFIILALTGLASVLQGAEPADVEFFEKSVRPILIDHCSKCHGEKKQSAGLRLDTVEGIRKGADDGPVFIAGKSKESRLIKSVRHEGEYAMPPNKKLPAETIDALTLWIDRGAVMPAAASGVAKSDGRDHWAFQPVKSVPGTHSIDGFITAKLQEKGLALSPTADRRTMLIRVSFDLIGLPPTLEEIEAFEKDTSPDAYEKVVDRLLASPQYGERWARHWLDVARYSDTKGYVFTEDRNFPYAYTYRDYVIDAFNSDKPYNRFIVEQIAADKLNLGDDNRALAAMGYLTLGRRFNNNMHDIIDDRIEVVTRGFLGLSVGCARCHDHKFDPIPINDYYSLYGVFASSVEPKDPPLLSGQEKSKEAAEFEREVTRLEALAAKQLQIITDETLRKYRTANAVAEYLIAWRDLRGASPQKLTQTIKDRGLNPIMLEHWRKRLDRARKDRDPLLAVMAELAEPADAEFASKRDEIVRRHRNDAHFNPLLLDALADVKPAKWSDAAMLLAEHMVVAARDAKPNPHEKQLVELLQGPLSPTMVQGEEAEAVIPVAAKKEYRKLRNAAQNFRATSPNAPGRAMVMQDSPKPMEPVVFLRGNPGNRGPKVPKQFLSVLTGAERKPFTDGSGRRELAEAIASPANPLTARVMVNRVWAWHFGQGIVRTPSDFGVRSDPPSHPELLDWLADEFVKDNWSVKKLHRRILLSKTYQQSSTITDAAMAADPENVFLSRSPRRRLEFEALRDRLLAAAGTLDLSQIGGRSVDIFKLPFSPRRSTYMFIERQNLPSTLRSFDLANPDQHSPGRHRTTVPQQALFLMNSPFLAEMARRTMTRPEIAAATNDEEKANRIYRAVLNRNATSAERRRAVEYLKLLPAAEGKLAPWEQLVQTLMMTNEFAFAD